MRNSIHPTMDTRAVSEEFTAQSAPAPSTACHWRDEGYPGLSRWMSSADDFLVLRRFEQLNIRVILRMQDRIVRKENELAELDEFSRGQRGRLPGCSSLRLEPLPQCEMVLDELRCLLKEYNKYILCYSQLRDLPSASAAQIQNVENWVSNHENSIDPEEQEFLKKGRDVIALNHKPKSPLRLRFQWLASSRLFRANPKHDMAQSDNMTYYYSNVGLETFCTFIIIITGLGLLIGPMWWLQFETQSIRRLGIITFFILTFTILLQLTTFAKPFEVLGATAAYSAVLVVFLQIETR